MAISEPSSTREYQARPGRIAVVVDNLETLHGPTRTVVELPHRLYWHADRTFNLGDAWEVREAYEAVLTEAVREDELRDWLDAATLRQLWVDLSLPRGVRAAWEDRHPALRQPNTAA